MCEFNENINDEPVPFKDDGSWNDDETMDEEKSNDGDRRMQDTKEDEPMVDAADWTKDGEAIEVATAEDMDADDLKDISEMMNDGMSPDTIAEWLMDNDMLAEDDYEQIKAVHEQICGAIEKVYGEANKWEMADKDTKTQIQGEWTNDILELFMDMGASSLIAGAALATSVTILAF